MVANQRRYVTRKTDKFPGIKAAARAFGVNRVTLYRVLKGQFPDRQGLSKRFVKFQREFLRAQGVRK
jgi:hypothetical protein